MSDLWLGLLLSIPIGIVTSLFTPWLQQKIESGSSKISDRRLRLLEQKKASLVLFQHEPTFLTHYLLNVVIKTSIIGASIGVISGILYGCAQLTAIIHAHDHNIDAVTLKNNIRTFLYLSGQFVALSGSIMVLNTCRPALSILRQLKRN